MDIENTIKKFLLREKIAFQEHTFPSAPGMKVLTFDYDNNAYNIKIAENRNQFTIKSFTATMDKFLVYKLMPEINELNKTMFCNFSWYEKDYYAYLLTCHIDQVCGGGMTINEHLVLKTFAYVYKGIKALEELLKDKMY